MIQLPNRTAQAGTFKTGTPNYVDVASGAAVAGMVTFGTRASADSWTNGDTLGILVSKDDSNWQVWTAVWVSATSRLNLATLEDSAGTLADADAVTVSATVTTGILTNWRAENQREMLTANRTYYVATTGSDSNNGLSAGAPFLTIQKAVDVVCSLDLSIYQATIQLADGTYTAGATLKSYVGALAPIIQGNATTPANVVVNVASGDAFAVNGGAWTVRNLRLIASVHGLSVTQKTASAAFSGLEFGACSRQIQVSLGYVTAIGNYSIVGGATRHIGASDGGTFFASGVTVTLSGTPAFSSAFVVATGCATVALYSCIFSGSVTGTRYNAASNAVINTSGAGATYLPGNASGTTATGGQYA
jgi:hypothetical protein